MSLKNHEDQPIGCSLKQPLDTEILDFLFDGELPTLLSASADGRAWLSDLITIVLSHRFVVGSISESTDMHPALKTYLKESGCNPSSLGLLHAHEQ